MLGSIDGSPLLVSSGEAVPFLSADAAARTRFPPRIKIHCYSVCFEQRNAIVVKIKGLSNSLCVVGGNSYVEGK